MIPLQKVPIAIGYSDRSFSHLSLFRLGLFLVATGFATAIGCGSEKYPLAPVSGRVTLEGQPVVGARVAFEPIAAGETSAAGPGSYGTTNGQGEFVLKTLHGKDGAVIATHRVALSTYRAKKGPNSEILVDQEERIPAQYHTTRSRLTFKVPRAGTDTAIFDLNSKE